MQINREQLLKKRAWLEAVAASAVDQVARDSALEEIAEIDWLLEVAA